MTNSRCIVIAVILIVLLASTSGKAGITLEKYHQVKATSDFNAYLTGVVVAYSTVNTYLRQIAERSPLYCTPNELSLNLQNYLQIIDDYVAKPDLKDINTPNAPFEFVLLLALQEMFPCE